MSRGSRSNGLREAPDVRHRSIDGTLAFADISGFTSLTERLSKKGKVGAEEMNDVLDSAFTDLLSVAYDYGAAVIKWGGDATLLLFTGDGHPARACRAAVEMQRTMRSIGRLKTSAGRVTLRMSVGIHTDLFDFFFVGKLHRELVIAGPGADATVAAESSAEAGETVITRTTAAALEPSHVRGRRGDCYLLAGAPVLEVDRAPSVGDVADVDLERCVPVAISSHLVEGGGEAEHRPLTIAFLRFAGVSELIATAGVDAVADALELTLDTAEGIALEHKVAFFDTDIAAGGGKIMLVSGAPTSSGHDEERMMRSLRAIADSHLPLQLHIGVDRGRLLAADFGPPYRRTYSFKGDAANLAARLMTKAAAGQILATPEVLARSRTEFHAEPLEPFSVKGKSEPVQAFLVGSAAGLRFQRGEAPLVGRDEELRTLLEAVESARRYDGRIVEVVGDPGIGKSRLIEELGENVTPDVFIQVQCDEYEATTPYHPFRSLLRSLLSTNGSGDDITPARLRRRVEQAAPQLLPWLPLLAVPVDLELPDTPETEPLQGEFRRRRLHEVVVDLLGMLLLRPTAIVFEDVHWLDEASAELLNHLSLTLEARPWLVVATRRDRPTTFSVPDEANPVQIWLEPLTADASSELIERALGELPLTARQAEELAGRAGGQPVVPDRTAGRRAANRRPRGVARLRRGADDPRDRSAVAACPAHAALGGRGRRDVRARPAAHLPWRTVGRRDLEQPRSPSSSRRRAAPTGSGTCWPATPPTKASRTAADASCTHGSARSSRRERDRRRTRRRACSRCTSSRRTTSTKHGATRVRPGSARRPSGRTSTRPRSTSGRLRRHGISTRWGRTREPASSRRWPTSATAPATSPTPRQLSAKPASSTRAT